MHITLRSIIVNEERPVRIRLMEHGVERGLEEGRVWLVRRHQDTDRWLCHGSSELRTMMVFCERQSRQIAYVQSFPGVTENRSTQRNGSDCSEEAFPFYCPFARAAFRA